MEIATDFLLLYCYVHPHDKEYKKMKNVYNKLKLHNKLSNMHLKKKIYIYNRIFISCRLEICREFQNIAYSTIISMTDLWLAHVVSLIDFVNKASKLIWLWQLRQTC